VKKANLIRQKQRAGCVGQKSKNEAKDGWSLGIAQMTPNGHQGGKKDWIVRKRGEGQGKARKTT